jgi:hypothetical protein
MHCPITCPKSQLPRTLCASFAVEKKNNNRVCKNYPIISNNMKVFVILYYLNIEKYP